MESVKIYQKGDKKHRDSFWYDGLIAEKKVNGEVIAKMYATGEIRIRNRETGHLVYDVKERNEGFDFELRDDGDLAKIDKSEKYEWVNNNWFSVLIYPYYIEITETPEEHIFHDYYEALDFLRSVE